MGGRGWRIAGFVSAGFLCVLRASQAFTQSARSDSVASVLELFTPHRAQRKQYGGRRIAVSVMRAIPRERNSGHSSKFQDIRGYPQQTQEIGFHKVEQCGRKTVAAKRGIFALAVKVRDNSCLFAVATQRLVFSKQAVLRLGSCNEAGGVRLSIRGVNSGSAATPGKKMGKVLTEFA